MVGKSVELVARRCTPVRARRPRSRARRVARAAEHRRVDDAAAGGELVTNAEIGTRGWPRRAGREVARGRLAGDVRVAGGVDGDRRTASAPLPPRLRVNPAATPATGAAAARAGASLPRSSSSRRSARSGARPRRVNVACAVTFSAPARRSARLPTAVSRIRIVPVRASGTRAARWPASGPRRASGRRPGPRRGSSSAGSRRPPRGACRCGRACRAARAGGRARP